MGPAQGVVGREEELAFVGGFLDDAAGLPAAVLIEGQPGIGKTTIWRAAVEAAAADRSASSRPLPRAPKPSCRLRACAT